MIILILKQIKKIKINQLKNNDKKKHLFKLNDAFYCLSNYE